MPTEIIFPASVNQMYSVLLSGSVLTSRLAAETETRHQQRSDGGNPFNVAIIRQTRAYYTCVSGNYGSLGIVGKEKMDESVEKEL